MKHVTFKTFALLTIICCLSISCSKDKDVLSDDSVALEDEKGMNSKFVIKDFCYARFDKMDAATIIEAERDLVKNRKTENAETDDMLFFIAQENMDFPMSLYLLKENRIKVFVFPPAPSLEDLQAKLDDKILSQGFVFNGKEQYKDEDGIEFEALSYTNSTIKVHVSAYVELSDTPTYYVVFTPEK